MIKQVLKIPAPVLRKKSKPVLEITHEIRQLVQDMKDTMYYEPGCGLAAPQIGVSLRVIAYDSPEDNEGFRVLINPRVVKADGREKGVEACLSIPGVSGEVARATSIQGEGMRLDGEKVSLALTDFTARILQHEIDHCDGILYIDRLSMAERSVIEKKLKKIRASAPSM